MRSPAWPSHSGGPSRGAAMLARERRVDHRPERLRLDQPVGAVGDGDRPLGVGAQRQARDAQHGRLLLDAAGVGDHERGAPRPGTGSRGSRAGRRPGRRGPRSSPAAPSVARPRGCSGRTTGSRAASVRSAATSRPRPPAYPRSRVGGGWRPRSARGCPGASGTGLGIEAVEVRQQRVDHGIARRGGPGRRIDALAGEVVEALRAGHEQQVRQDVRDPPVDLLRHRRVEAAQARLDVRERDRAAWRTTSAAASVELTSPYTTTSAGRSATNSSSSAARSAAVWCAWLPEPDAEAHVGRRQRQVPEEDVGQQRVVVLAGVHDALAARPAPPAPG